MNDTTYNGWTNYATWRVNLEIFDNLSMNDFEGLMDKFEEEGGVQVCLIDTGQLAIALSERAEYYVEVTSEAGFARDYAIAFLGEVNFWEIAEHMIDDHTREQA